MNRIIYNTEWKKNLYHLIQKAKTENKWLWCQYGNIWFSPEELENEHIKGSFMWGAINWKLRDPLEKYNEIEEQVNKATQERDRIKEILLK